MLSRVVKRTAGGAMVALGIGLCSAFVLSGAWFGVVLGGFIGLIGVQALVYPDDVFRAKAKDLPDRGSRSRDPKAGS